MTAPNIDAVFISDLHLNPEQPEITQRFSDFVQWAAENTRALYILGDFFHVWAGDDSLNAWSESIALQLAGLASRGVHVFYMHGNRDFLLGKKFAELSVMKILSDPEVIELNGERVLLTHGDGYCTNDHAHQWLMRITRNRWFSTLFLLIPYGIRKRLVSKVRIYSQTNKQKAASTMDIVAAVMLADMRKHNVSSVIHGHIHKPGLTTHSEKGITYKQYVLSDWDDKPTFLCYYNSCGFSFDIF